MEPSPSAGSPPDTSPDLSRAAYPLWLKTALPLLICLLATLVYAPALNRVAAADHIGYFAELNGARSLRAGLALVDYANARRYCRGDDVLYRPLLFTVLAVENTLFGQDHRAWNAANLAFHISACLALYLLLRRVQPPLFAGLWACWAALHPATYELVVWSHLGGYILAVTLALAAASQAMAAISQPQRMLRRRMAAYAALMLLSMLFYELMALACLALAAIAALRVKQKKLPASALAVLLLPLFAYGALYAGHVRHAKRWAYVDGAPLAAARPGTASRLAEGAAWTCARWTARVVLPSTMLFSVDPMLKADVSISISRRGGLTLALAALWLTAAGAWGWARGWRSLRERWPWVFLSAACFCGYAAAICLGRSADDAANRGYYLYVPVFMCAIGFCSLWDWQRLGGRTRMVAAASLTCVIGLSAAQLTSDTVRLREANKASDRFITALVRYVDAHRTEPGFSFHLAHPSDRLDPRVPLIEGYPDDPNAPRIAPRLHEILFRPWINEATPRYILSWDETACVLSVRTQP